MFKNSRVERYRQVTDRSIEKAATTVAAADAAVRIAESAAVVGALRCTTSGIASPAPCGIDGVPHWAEPRRIRKGPNLLRRRCGGKMITITVFIIRSRVGDEGGRRGVGRAASSGGGVLSKRNVQTNNMAPVNG